MKAHDLNIQEWFSEIRTGRIVLPRFQRHEAWSYGQVEGLLENIIRNPALPIGALLTLDKGPKNAFVARGIVGAPDPAENPTRYLLDGQQRLTALWRSLTDDYDDATFFISLTETNSDEESESEDLDAPSVVIVKRYGEDYQKPFWANSLLKAFDRGLVPLSALCPGTEGESLQKEWENTIRDALLADGRYDEYESAKDRVTSLRQRVANYNIPYLSLGAETGPFTAIRVFTNMNTSFTKLSDFDIVVAQLEGEAQSSLHDMVEGLVEKSPALRSAFGRTEDYVLSIAALRAGMPPLKQTYLSKPFIESLEGVWNGVEAGVSRAMPFLADEGILNAKSLPSELVVYLTSALFAEAEGMKTDKLGNLRNTIRKTIWRAIFTPRYEKTSATRAFNDFKSIRAFIRGEGKESDILLFNEETNPIPSAKDMLIAGWPSRKDRWGRGVLATSLRAGAIDLATQEKISRKNYHRRQLHHVFPVKMLGVDRNDPYVSRALNCALVTEDTNKMFGAKPPATYIQDRITKSAGGEDDIASRLRTHRLPISPAAYADYDDFLHIRSEIVASDISKLCEGLNS